MKSFIIAALFIITTNTTMAKSLELILRVNGHDSYGVPAQTFIDNMTPQINNRGDIAMSVMGLTDTQFRYALYVKKESDTFGQVVYITPGQRLISDPSINDLGQILFNQSFQEKSDGLFIYNIATDRTNKIVKAYTLSKRDYVQATINNNKDISFRGIDENSNRSIILKRKGLKPFKLASHDKKILDKKVSYFFTPSLSKNHLVFKARFGERRELGNERPDAILRYNLKTNTLTKVVDKDFDSKSKFTSFENAIAVNDKGAMAFYATLESKQKVLVIHSKGQSKIVVREGQGELKSFERFSVKMNNENIVAFRGVNKLGKRAIFYYKSGKLEQLVAEGDSLKSDIGPLRIRGNNIAPGFSGGININDKNEIVFNAILEDLDSHYAGQGVYKASI